MKNKILLLLIPVMCISMYSCKPRDKNISSQSNTSENKEAVTEKKSEYEKKTIPMQDLSMIVQDIKTSEKDIYVLGYVDEEKINERFIFVDVLTSEMNELELDIEKSYVNDFILDKEYLYICYDDYDYNTILSYIDRETGEVSSEIHCEVSEVSYMYIDNNKNICILDSKTEMNDGSTENRLYIYDKEKLVDTINLDESLGLLKEEKVYKMCDDKNGGYYVLTMMQEPAYSSVIRYDSTKIYHVSSDYNITDEICYADKQLCIKDFILTDDGELYIAMYDNNLYSVDNHTYELLEKNENFKYSTIGFGNCNLLYEDRDGNGIYRYDIDEKESVPVLLYENLEEEISGIYKFSACENDILICTSDIGKVYANITCYQKDDISYKRSLMIPVEENSYIHCFCTFRDEFIYMLENKDIFDADETNILKSYAISKYDMDGNYVDSIDITETIGEISDIFVRKLKIDEDGTIYIIYDDMSGRDYHTNFLVLDNKGNEIFVEEINNKFFDFDIIFSDENRTEIIYVAESEILVNNFVDGKIEPATRIRAADNIKYPISSLYCSDNHQKIYFSLTDNTLYSCDTKEGVCRYELDLNELTEYASLIVPLDDDDILVYPISQQPETECIIVSRLTD